MRTWRFQQEVARTEMLKPEAPLMCDLVLRDAHCEIKEARFRRWKSKKLKPVTFRPRRKWLGNLRVLRQGVLEVRRIHKVLDPLVGLKSRISLRL